jgi:hypothetical protein
MNRPRWWEQSFAPEGSAASEGILRQLGRSSLDPLTVLVREASQNSWDARRNGESVHFAVHLRQIDSRAADAWARLLLPEPDPPGRFGLGEKLSDQGLVMLTVSDRGTTGLGGPLRADETSAEPADFANFVRNIGEPRDKELGGGTYGFGKGIFFTLSRTGTVLVRSRCRWRGRTQTRLMGAALAHSYSRGGRRFTGRHWWGALAEDGRPDPILDADADETAQLLGFPFRAEEELGTDVVVVAADLGLADSEEPEALLEPRSASEAGAFLASAILWNLWPKMLPSEHQLPPMSFAVTVDGEEVRVPDPATSVGLRPFVDAYRALEDEPPLMRRRPKTVLGEFAAAEFMAPTRPDPLDVAAPFAGPAHHCALMRQAELVVCYRAGPVPADQMIQYGAVFRSDRDVDGHFADAEPPTHDDWVAAQLDRNGRSVVRCALREIDERMRAVAGSMAFDTAASGAPQVPLGGLSSELATLMPGVAGTGGGAGQTERHRPNTPSRGALVRAIGSPRLAEVDGETYVVADVDVLPSAWPVRLEVIATVVIDSGRETDPPAGAAAPEVVSIRSSDGALTQAGGTATIQPDHPRHYRAIVRPAPETVTRVRFAGTLLEGRHARESA